MSEGAMIDGVDALFRPRSVAVVGASADAGKTSGRPIAYLQKHGYEGVIYPVNPRATMIAGLPCVADIAALPHAPDVAIVLLGAERANQAVAQLAARGTRAAIVLASGYAETGPQGAELQRQLLQAAGPMRLLGPNTIGLVNLTDRITLSASGALELDDLQAGSVAVISQSGGILGSLLSRGTAAGVGFSKLISTSNEADLQLSDFIDALVDDEATRVIALYLEGLRDVASFRAAAARAAAAHKPLVVFKIGRSASGASAAASHTGALAGADRMYDALFREVGALRAQTFADLIDLPAALVVQRPLRGKRVAILTSTGGAGTLVADCLGVAGFEAPPPDAATAARLRALQKDAPSVLDRNPIDVTLAGLHPDVLGGAIAALLDSPAYDAVMVIAGSSALSMPDLLARAIRASMPHSDKPVLAYVSPSAPNVQAALNRQGVPAFAAPESCASAMLALLAVARARGTLAGSIAGASIAHPATGTLLAAASAAGSHQGPTPGELPLNIGTLPVGSLDEAQAKALFARFGIAAVREIWVTNGTQARAAVLELGEPVVLKLLSNVITHKTEAGGVAVGVTLDRIEARLQQMRDDVAQRTGTADEAFLVQQMISGATEMILGLHRDPLGCAVLLGMGGVTAELYDDTALRMVPAAGELSRDEARAMIEALKTWPLLDGYRGRGRADVDALVDAIVAFSRLASALGERLQTAEINPLFVLASGQGVRAADGVAVLLPPSA